MSVHTGPQGPPSRPQRTPSQLATWGPFALVLILVIALGGIATAKGRGSSSTVSTLSHSASGPTSWANNPDLPITYADAKKANTVDEYDWGVHCDPKTGRLKIPSVYSPPCIPVWNGTKPWKDLGRRTVTSNGGATSPGVDSKTITVVYYIPSPQDLFSTAQALGVLDAPDIIAEQAERTVDAYNHLYELYGRKVKLVKFQASGNGVDPTSARSDAIKVATQYHAFASLGGPSQAGAYADELAKRKVLCIACGMAVPDSDFQKNAPYMWGIMPTPEQFVQGVFDFGVANLWNRKARFSGDASLRAKNRVIGTVYYEQSPPVFTAVRDKTLAHYSKLGYSSKVIETYLLDPSTLNSQAQTIIGHLKSAGVSTVVFLGDPLMPIYLTQQAQLQNYHPEWVITGTVFTDTTAAARLYQPDQWAHAFGTSSLPARTKPQLQDPWRVYKWYSGNDPVAIKSMNLIGPMAMELFIGLHMAGPDLTPFTYAGGMFRYPPSGGDILNPQISFGFHGLFPKADYVSVDDFTVVWWDSDVVGVDEQNKSGKGMWAYVAGGHRYLLGSKPPTVGDSVLFNPQGAVTMYDRIPAKAGVPSYPRWRSFP